MGSNAGRRAAARGAAAGRHWDSHPGVCRLCDKFAYGDKQAAKRVIRTVPCDRDTMRAYRCPAGNGWHIGHDKFKGRNER